MAIGQHNRTTAVSIIQIGISRNTKCVIKDGFRRDSYIRLPKMGHTSNWMKIQYLNRPSSLWMISLCVWHSGHPPESGSPMHRAWSLWCHWGSCSSAEYDYPFAASAWPKIKRFTLQYTSYYSSHTQCIMPSWMYIHTYMHHTNTNYKTLLLYTQQIMRDANFVDSCWAV